MWQLHMLCNWKTSANTTIMNMLHYGWMKSVDATCKQLGNVDVECECKIHTSSYVSSCRWEQSFWRGTVRSGIRATARQRDLRCWHLLNSEKIRIVKLVMWRNLECFVFFFYLGIWQLLDKEIFIVDWHLLNSEKIRISNLVMWRNLKCFLFFFLFN